MEVSHSNQRRLGTSGTKNFSEDANEIPSVLSSGSHQNLIVDQIEKFRGERPAFCNLTLEPRLVGVDLVGIQQANSLRGVWRDNHFDVAVGEVVSVFKKPVEYQPLAVALGRVAFEVNKQRADTPDLL